MVWVIPIIAAVVGAWVAISRIESEGPKIEIIFGSAEGLEAGKTRIEYKGVEVGTITAIRLTEDHQRVIATAQMTPRTEQFLVEDTEFWVVRPRISGANVSGLGTLISGAYIGVEIGVSKSRNANSWRSKRRRWSRAALQDASSCCGVPTWDHSIRERRCSSDDYRSDRSHLTSSTRTASALT